MTRPRHIRSTLRLAAVCVAAAIGAGCAAISKNPAATDASGNPVSTLIPNKSLNVTPNLGIAIETILLGAVIYWAVDPLAPN